ncbi:hyalin-like [Anneissia japonica]|uniref:hyalin-like n=1 Tax=Anneissia japonica TaxID=1529436 RepID=UPI0014257CB5|nr:hyalin-like [Anneissia japonica]
MHSCPSSVNSQLSQRQNGYYIHVGSNNDIRTMYIPTVPATWSDFCLTFYYYISGRSDLAIEQYDNIASNYRRVLFISENIGQWKYISLQLINSHRYLELVGRASNGKVAVDNICNSKGLCVENKETTAMTCPSNVTVETDTGAATASVNYSSAIHTNCVNDSVISPDPTQIFPAHLGIGVEQFTFIATDSSRNNHTCTFTVTVNDTEKPKLSCPKDETVNTDEGSATASVDYSSKINASDNSGNTSTIIPYPNETFPVDIGIGVHTFTFTATDSSGNNGTCRFTITVQDTEKPTINCPPDETIYTDEGSATALVDYSSKINATDNSRNITTISPNPYETIPDDLGIGAHTFTFTATDSSGNNGTCTFTITVQDTEKPTVNCPPDETIDTDEGSATASVDYSSKINASDNSGNITAISPNPNESIPDDLAIGAHTFNFTATDPSGNNGSCTFTISVQG